MSWSLEDRCAVCLAASEGLGRGIALEVALAGARTLLVSRTEDTLRRTAVDITSRLKAGGAYPGVTRWHRPEILAADLMEPGAAAGVVAHAAKLFGKIDILVNNIGGPAPGLFDDLTPENLEDAFRRLVGALVDQIREALPWLRKSDAPRIVTVTSISARQPIPGLLLSNTFRPGLMGLAKSLAQEWGREGILVNNLAPGMFETGRVVEVETAAAKARGVAPEEIRRERIGEIPLGRFGTPDELGRAAVFLASPANTYITGQTILVDGGLYRGI